MVFRTLLSLIIILIIFFPEPIESGKKLSSLLKQIGWKTKKASLLERLSSIGRGRSSGGHSMQHYYEAASKVPVPSLLENAGRAPGPPSSLLERAGSMGRRLERNNTSKRRQLPQSLLATVEAERPQSLLAGAGTSSSSFSSSSLSSSARCKCHRSERLAGMNVMEEESGLLASETPFSEGSQGEIYHGFSIKLNHCVAVKTINYKTKDSMLHQMAKREAEIYKYLKEKKVQYVAEIYASHDFPDNGLFLLVMELGAYSLRDYWDNRLNEFRDDTEKTTEIFTLSKHIVSPFIHLHAGGILHSDFKMENAMMVRLERPGGMFESLTKLIDFGGGHFIHSTDNIDALFKPTFVVAAAGYMSPEQKLRKQYNDRLSTKADIWAIGCVVFEWLTNESANLLWFYEAKEYNDIIAGMEKLQEYVEKLLERWPYERQLRYRPLFHLAKACLHVNPERRPRAYRLSAYLHGWCTLRVSSVYENELRSIDWNGDISGLKLCDEMDIETYKKKAFHRNSLMNSLT